jgi:Tol biopolymer transport system component
MNHSFIFLIISLAFSFSVFAKANKVKKNNSKISTESKQITKVGSNRQPLFISDDSIIFISSNRGFNKDPQIYFKNLTTGKEKQLSYQKGQISLGAYDSTSTFIYYASSTDEEKESPYILKKYLDRFPTSVKNDDFFQIDFEPQEIYSSLLDGSQITRLTEHLGFDSSPTYLKSKDRIYYSSWQSNQLTFYAKSIKQSELAPWKVTKTAGNDLGLQISSDEKQFVWSRFSPDFKSSQILLSDPQFKDIQMLTLNSGISWSPVWNPNNQSIIYSARFKNKDDFDLYEVSRDGNCQRQITSEAGDEFYPTISPKGDKILFTSTKSGKEQIHQIDYPEPITCP